MKKIGTLILFILIMTVNLYPQQEVKIVCEEVTPAGESVTYEIPLRIYSPEEGNNTGMAVVICPGGGYARLAMEHEGTQVAEWLQSVGITGVVLTYRLPKGNKEIPLFDVQRAVRYVRDRAGELGIDSAKVGIAGFSAGGHLASTASTRFHKEGFNTRPDFSILFYPVITMREWTHSGSRNNLLGENPSEEDIHAYSNEEQVTPDTPPTILLLSDDDKGVVPKNSVKYYERLKECGVPASLYIFPEGGHGWGMRKTFKYHKQMLELLHKWLIKTNDSLNK